MSTSEAVPVDTGKPVEPLPVIGEGLQSSEDATPGAGVTQTADANISTLADANKVNANIPDNVSGIDADKSRAESWRGDERYFQTGEKAGQLRPKFRDQTGSEKPASKEPGQIKGLNVDALKASGAPPEEIQRIAKEESKRQKEKKKQVNAAHTSKIIMRGLDMATNFISKGQFWKGLEPQQIKERVDMRAVLEDEWREYLLTLDVETPPWVGVAIGTMGYMALAFQTQGGQERAQSLKEKVIGKIASKIFGRFFGG